MYEIFEELCENKGVSAYKVSQETGVKTATLTAWKQGKYKPKDDKLQKIADYFGVSLEYLKTKTDERFSADDAELLAKIRTDDALSQALKTYFTLSDKERNHVIELISLLGKE